MLLASALLFLNSQSILFLDVFSLLATLLMSVLRSRFSYVVLQFSANCWHRFLMCKSRLCFNNTASYEPQSGISSIILVIILAVYTICNKTGPWLIIKTTKCYCRLDKQLYIWHMHWVYVSDKCVYDKLYESVF